MRKSKAISINKHKPSQEEYFSISALMATVLLIVIAITLITILLLWGKGFTNKSISQVDTFNKNTDNVYFIKPVEFVNGSLIFKNISPDNKDINIIGYKIITDDEDINKEIQYLDNSIILSKGSQDGIRLPIVPNDQSFSVQLYTNTRNVINIGDVRNTKSKVVVATPTVNYASGVHSSSFQVVLSCQTGSASIYYTLDGTTPTIESTLYVSQIDINQTTNLKAIAYKDNLYSDVLSVAYTFIVMDPIADVNEGTYISSKAITLDTTTEDATIYYTLDGTTPTIDSILYISPIEISETTTLKAIALKDGWTSSNILTLVYSFSQIVDFSTGMSYSCFVLDTGEVYCFGYYSDVSSSIPIKMNLLSNVVKVRINGSASGAGPHGCVLLNTGNIKCWGANGYGQLGNGTTTASYSVPVDVIGINNAIDIELGRAFACALLDTGGVKCWGDGQYGQIGVGDFNYINSTPQDVNISDVNQIALGAFHVCAKLNNSIVKCWGANSYYQLDDHTTDYRNTPVIALDLNNVSKLSAGYAHTCILFNDRNVKCIGMNDYGQLGDSSTSTRSVPVNVSGLSNIQTISTQGRHNCALLDTNLLKCWGANSYGQLGDNSTSHRSTPVSVLNIFDVKKITTGGENYINTGHTCALKNNNTLLCWGSNVVGQLGDGTTTQSKTPVYVQLP